MVAEDLSGNVEGRVQVFGVHVGLCPAEQICVRLDETFRRRLPGELTVSVLVPFTTTGDSDCVDTGARIGAVELRTPPGSPLDIAVTITPSADGWRPVG